MVSYLLHFLLKFVLIDRPHLITLAAFIWKKTESRILGDFTNPTLALYRSLGVGYFVPNDYFLIHLGAFNTPEAVADTSLLHSSHCNSPCPLYIFCTPCLPAMSLGRCPIGAVIVMFP